MDNKDLNTVALELAIKSLENKKHENKWLIITLFFCLALVLIAFCFITVQNDKRVDRVVDLLENSSKESIDIDYEDGDFNGNATLGDNNNYGKN